MRRPTVLEALKKLMVLKFTPDRDGAGAKATIRLLGDDRRTQVWWRKPREGEPLIVNFRPYPDGWTRLSPAEQSDASKEVVLAITAPKAMLPKTSRGKQSRRRR
jgi:hypothetical protein